MTSFFILLYKSRQQPPKSVLHNKSSGRFSERVRSAARCGNVCFATDTAYCLIQDSICTVLRNIKCVKSCYQLQLLADSGKKGHSLSSCLGYFGTGASQALSILINFQFSAFQRADIKPSFRRLTHQFINPLSVCWGRHACLRGSKANWGTGGKRNPPWLSK